MLIINIEKLGSRLELDHFQACLTLKEENAFDHFCSFKQGFVESWPKCLGMTSAIWRFFFKQQEPRYKMSIFYTFWKINYIFFLKRGMLYIFHSMHFARFPLLQVLPLVTPLNRGTKCRFSIHFEKQIEK